MLVKDWINYDMTDFRRNGIGTDIFGDVFDAKDLFGENVFDEILSVHVIEHFRPPDGRRMLEHMLAMLKPGGKAIVEGPDVLGVYQMYWERKKSIEEVIMHLFGCQPHVNKWGNQWSHKWGYTQETLGKLMTEIGYKVVHKGIGMKHGMGPRDFRVEGVKP